MAALHPQTSLLERQFRFTCAVRPRPRRGRRRVTKTPANALLLPDMAVNDDLHRTAWAVRAGQKDALLNFNRVGQGREGPNLAILQQQNDASAVGKTTRLDSRMKMKSEGELRPFSRRNRASIGCRKAVLSVDDAPIRAQSHGAVMNDIVFA